MGKSLVTLTGTIRVRLFPVKPVARNLVKKMAVRQRLLGYNILCLNSQNITLFIHLF
jgi:hypothetical protein